MLVLMNLMKNVLKKKQLCHDATKIVVWELQKVIQQMNNVIVKFGFVGLMKKKINN